MFSSHQKERYSDAWLCAIAALAGFATAKPLPDTDSIDWIISATNAKDLPMRPRVEVQLKCTQIQDIREGHLYFAFDVKDYNNLTVTSIIPRILVVLTVPEDLHDWHSHSMNEMKLRKCAYWVSLHGMTDTHNQSSITIAIPVTQTFTPDMLVKIMHQIQVSAASMKGPVHVTNE